MPISKSALLVFIAMLTATEAAYSQQFRFHLQEATIDDVHRAIREGQVTCRGLAQLYINQPVASIAKKEEILYVLGQEDEPIVLERHSPVLHLIQQIRDETHRFAVTFHRQRRGKRQTETVLSEIPGVGVKTAQKLLK